MKRAIYLLPLLVALISVAQQVPLIYHPGSVIRAGIGITPVDGKSKVTDIKDATMTFHRVSKTKTNLKTEFSGSSGAPDKDGNVRFQIPIPEDIAPGDYLISIKVTTKDGKSEEYSQEELGKVVFRIKSKEVGPMI